MVYIPKINDYVKILTDEEVKVFVAINFIREQNSKKAAKSFYIFLTSSHEVGAIKFF